MGIGGINKLFERLGSRGKDAQASYDRGAAALRAGAIDDARTALVEAVNLAPDHLVRAFSAGEMLAAAGCHAEAEQIFRHVGKEARRELEGVPQNFELRLLVAAACERQGQLAEAADHLAVALSVDVDHPGANRRLAVILGQLGDARGSIRCWRRVLARAVGEDLEALTLLGTALSTDQQHDEAIAVLTEVSRRRPRSGSAQADLGMALLSARRKDQALASFTRARDLDPTSAQAHCGLGLVYQQLGRWWEAAAAYRMAEQLAPDNPAGPTNLAAVLQILGEHDQARAALRRAAVLAPHDEEISRALAEEAVPAIAGDEVTRPALSQPPPPSMVGDLRTRPLPDLLNTLEAQSKSGVLSVSTRAGGAAAVRVVRGKVVSASAPGTKLLADRLLEQRLVRRQDLQDALDSSTDDRDDKLGAALVRRGHLGQAQLGAVLWRDILVAVEHVAGWTEGTFTFQDGADEEPPPAAYTPAQIALSLAKRRAPRGRPAASSHE